MVEESEMIEGTTLRSGIIEHPIGATGSFSLTTASGDVDIRAVDGDTVRIIAADPDDASVLDLYVVESGEGYLRVRSPRGGFVGVDIGGFKWGQRIGGGGNTDLQVEVPRGARVELTTVSGDIRVAGLRGQQRYKTVSGDLTLEDLAGFVELDDTSGDVRLRSPDSIRADLRTVSGDIAARAEQFEGLTIQTMSGDMRIEGALAAAHDHSIETVSGDTRLTTTSGLTIQARTVSGDIRSDVAHRTTTESGRRSIIIGDGRARLAFRSMSGDLQLTGKGRLLTAEGATWRGEVSERVQEAMGAIPLSPTPQPPAAPAAPEPLEAARLEILRALQAGDIDVATATQRLAAIDEAGAA